jgi:hypothetical protein
MVKLVFFRDVGFADFGNWLGRLKSGKQIYFIGACYGF